MDFTSSSEVPQNLTHISRVRRLDAAFHNPELIVLRGFAFPHAPVLAEALAVVFLAPFVRGLLLAHPALLIVEAHGFRF
jgi:hypothetical protein